jgi:hypothetical protein
MAPLEAPPSAEADVEADGCRETAACPLIEESPSAAVFPADPWAEAPPPSPVSIPLLSPLPKALPRLSCEPAEPPLSCPWLEPPPAERVLSEPLLAELELELDGTEVAACPMPASDPPAPPTASRPPAAGIPGLAALGCELAAL